MKRSDSDRGHILVLGARGMLGSDLTQVLSAAGRCVRAVDRPEFDIRDPEQIAAALDGCDAVVNCAAYTDVDGAENDIETARAVNALAVGQLGAAAAERGIYVLHISTDFVFPGTGDEPYCEEDVPAPVNAYGRTKLAGEDLLFRSRCRASVLRVQWTYGAHGANFVSKLLDRARRSEVLHVVDDQVGAPTWTRDVSAAIVALLRWRAVGLYHYAACGYASRFAVAEAILERVGLSCDLRPCRTADFPAAAARPLNSRFACAKFDRDIGVPRLPWRTSLTRFLSRDRT